MTDINPTPSWAAVRQLEIGEYALGGPDGNMNEQAKSLAARSELLKQYAALPYESKTGGYALNERVQLATGDIVKSTVANNTIDPNVDMTGWLNFSKLTSLNFDMFGVPKTNSSARMQLVFDESARLKIPVINPSGTYELDAPVTIKYDHDLTGTILKPKSTLSGASVTITREDTPTIDYDAASSVVTTIKTLGVWVAKNPQHTALSAVTVLNNSYLIFNTSQDYYRYRGDIKKRIELLKYFRDGNFESGCYFDFDLSTVTSVKVQKFAPYVMQSKGLNFDETDATCDSILRVLDTNKIKISGLNFIDNSTSNRDGAQNKIVYVRAHDIECDHAFAESANRPIGSARTGYMLSMNYCYQPMFTGLRASNVPTTSANNHCRRVTFKDCDVGIIDFHEPCYEYLRIEGGTLSHGGVQVSMIGDLYIDNVRQTFRPNGSSQPNGAIVKTRDDIGGWFCGDIYIKKHTMDGAVTTHSPLFYIGQGTTANYIPDGSPIPKKFANSIYVDGIKTSSKHILHAVIQSNLQGVTPFLELPDLLSVDKLELPSDHTNPLLMYTNQFKAGGYKQLKLTNSVFRYVILSAGDALNKTTLTSCKKRDGSGFDLINMSSSAVDIISDTVLNKYSELDSGSYSTYTPQVRINDSKFINQNLSNIVETSGSTYNRIKANKLDTRYLSTKGTFLTAQLNKISFDACLDNDANGFLIYWSTSTASVTAQVAIGSESFEFKVYYNDGNPKVEDVYVRPLNNAKSVVGGVTVSVVVVDNIATLTFLATNISKIILQSNM